MGVVCLWIYFDVFVHSYSRLWFRLSALQMERTNFPYLKQPFAFTVYIFVKVKVTFDEDFFKEFLV
jgi:hypothetical protein